MDNELWAGKPVAAELVSAISSGLAKSDVHGPDELQAVGRRQQKMFSDLMFVVEIEPFSSTAIWWPPAGSHRGNRRWSGAVHRQRHSAVADGRFVGTDGQLTRLTVTKPPKSAQSNRSGCSR